MFLIPSLYILEKISLSTNIRNKCVIRKINYFDVMQNVQIYLSEIVYFEHDHRFPFSREMGNIRSCKEVRLLKLQVVRIVFLLAFLKLLKNEDSFGESFSFPFLAKYFNRIFKYLF